MTRRASYPLSAALSISVGLACGCGSTSSAGLFGSSSTPTFAFGAGGGGNGGDATGTGGVPFVGGTGADGSSGGFVSAGGFGGGIDESGGATGSGGFFETGGTSTGSGGITQPVTDASTFNALACDYSGMWATYASVPVTWPATIAILAGGGNLNQWTLSKQVQTSPGTIQMSTIPCAIQIPDFQTNIFGGASAFGIRFPNAIFDDGGVPAAKFVISGALGPTGGFAFSSTPFAFTIGFTMGDPTTAAWPGTANITEVDQDQDQHPGVTIIPATGTGYSYPPTSVPFPGTPLADLLYLAQRTVSTLSGPLTSCDELKGNVTIAVIGGVPAIDSSVIGCHVQGGSDCVSAQWNFIDENRPVFTPTGPGSMISVRLPDGATCADARARFPSP